MKTYLIITCILVGAVIYTTTDYIVDRSVACEEIKDTTELVDANFVYDPNIEINTSVLNVNTESWLSDEIIAALDKDTIKRIGESGKICEVFGHNWKYHPSPNQEDYNASNYRTCKICGKCEKQDLRWK